MCTLGGLNQDDPFLWLVVICGEVKVICRLRLRLMNADAKSRTPGLKFRLPAEGSPDLRVEKFEPAMPQARVCANSIHLNRQARTVLAEIPTMQDKQGEVVGTNSPQPRPQTCFI